MFFFSPINPKRRTEKGKGMPFTTKKSISQKRGKIEPFFKEESVKKKSKRKRKEEKERKRKKG